MPSIDKERRAILQIERRWVKEPLAVLKVKPIGPVEIFNDFRFAASEVSVVNMPIELCPLDPERTIS